MMFLKSPHYLVRLGVHAIITALSSGVVFGWVAVVLMMNHDGLFYNLCDTHNTTVPITNRSIQYHHLQSVNSLPETHGYPHPYSPLFSSVLSSISYFYDPKNSYDPFRSIESSRTLYDSSQPVVQPNSMAFLFDPMLAYSTLSSTVSSIANSVMGTRGNDPVPVRYSCPSRQGYLNTIYVVGVFSNTVSYLAWGVCLDSLGPRLTAMIGFVGLVAGNFLFYISNDTTRAWWHIGIALIGAGGVGTHLPSFHLANLVPIEHRGLASSIFPGMFNVSGMTWAILGIFNTMGASLSSIFGVFTLVMVGCAVANFWIQSWKAIPSNYHQQLLEELEAKKEAEKQKQRLERAAELSEDEVEMSNMGHTTPPVIAQADVDGVDIKPTLPYELLTEEEKAKLEKKKIQNKDEIVIELDRPSPSTSPSPKNDKNSVSLLANVPDTRYARWKYLPNLQQLSFKDQVMSVYYLWTIIYVSSHLTRNSFWQGSINAQFAYIDTSPGKHLSQIYSVIVMYAPILVLLSFPVGGMIIDRRGLPFMISIATVFQLLYSFLALIPNLNLQIVTGLCFILGRTYIMTAYFSCIGTVCGFKTFGKMSAIGMASVGIVNFISIPLTWLVNNKFDGSFFWPNLLMLVWCIPLAYYPYYLWSTGRKQAMETEDNLEKARIAQLEKEQQLQLESLVKVASQRTDTTKEDGAQGLVKLDI